MNKVPIQPNGPRLLVEVDDFQYRGTLVIPDRAKVRPTTGTVAACGPDLEHWLGKRVIYGMMSGTAIQLKNRPTYVMLNIEEVLGEVVTNEVLEEKEFMAM